MNDGQNDGPGQGDGPPERDIGRRVGDVVGDAVGGAVGGVLSTAVKTVGTAGEIVGKAGHLLVGAFKLPGMEARNSIAPSAPGDAPGIDSMKNLDRPPSPAQARVACVEYGASGIARREVDPGELRTLATSPRPDGVRVRWIQVAGLHPYVVNELREALAFHTLAAEDILRPPQRPRMEAYADHLFIVTQFIRREPAGLQSEQVSLLMYDGLLVSFQESLEGHWGPIEDRLQRKASRLRQGAQDYLAYAILDVVVDHCYPILEDYALQLEALEDGAMEASGSDLLHQAHRVKRDLAVLRRMLWPVRELIAELRNPDVSPLVSESTRAFLSDVQDHCAQLVDMTETFRDLAGNVTELYISISSHRMNEIMKVLTVISTIFIPIGFLAGVFGMNFRVLPGLDWEYGYFAFWALCLSVVVGLLWFFRRRGWFG